MLELDWNEGFLLMNEYAWVFGGTQNIKSMKNLKATILGNAQHIKHGTKFKINEKDIH